VALIESGIASVKGLGQAGKVVNGPDPPFESQAANLRNRSQLHPESQPFGNAALL
jgi:hypothetical protein